MQMNSDLVFTLTVSNCCHLFTMGVGLLQFKLFTP